MSMGISGYGNLLQNYRVPTIPAVSVEGVKQQDAVKRQDAARLQEQSVSGLQTYDAPSVSEVRKPDARLEDISVTFNRQDDFDYIGRDSDIRSLDVERALSDMEKDQMLQQYQYFVGSSRNLYAGQENADGIVIPKF